MPSHHALSLGQPVLQAKPGETHQTLSCVQGERISLFFNEAIL